jgi:flagellum-specific peptidoglycan hydrolase FlgJ
VQWVVDTTPRAIAALGDLLSQIGDWQDNVARPALRSHLIGWGIEFAAWIQEQAEPRQADAEKVMIGHLNDWIDSQRAPLKARLGAWANAFGDWVTDAGPYMLGQLTKLGVNFIQWINDEAKALAHALVTWAHAFGDWISGEGKPSLDKAGSDIATTIYNAVISDITSWPTKLGNAITDAVGKAVTNFRAGYNGTPDTNAQAAAPSAAAGTTSGPVTDLGPIDSSSQEAFVRTFTPYAQQISARTGIDTSTVVSMAASESNYGKAPGNELFGIKATPGTASQTLGTHEGENGGTAQNAAFGAYDTPAAAADAFVSLVTKHYTAALGAQTPADLAAGLRQGNEGQHYYTAGQGEYTGILSGIQNRVAPQVAQEVATNPINATGGVGTSSAAYGPTPLGWNQDQVIAAPASFNVTEATAKALCGPTAYAMIEAALGRPPTVGEAIAANKSWSTAGEGGFSAFLNALASAGNVTSNVQYNPSASIGTSAGGGPSSDALAAFAQSVQSGAMGTISTPGHYFQASGYNPDTQKFNVGDTGAVVGGAQEMSLAEMVAREGAITGLVTETNALGTAAQAVFGTTLPQSFTVSDAAVQLFADKFHISWDAARADLTQIENGAKTALGTIVPGQFAVTDQAVEDFANKWGVSWTEARVILAAGTTAVATSVAGMNSTIATSTTAATTALSSSAAAANTAGASFQGSAQELSAALGITDQDVETFAALHQTTWDDARTQINAAASVYGTDAQAISQAYGVTDTAVQTFANLHRTTWDDARTKLNEMVGVYGVDSRQVSDAFGITDTAIRTFATVHNTTWDDARKKLNEAAVNAGSVLGDKGLIPTAAGQTSTAIQGIDTAIDTVKTPLQQLKDAALTLANQGLDPASQAAKDLNTAIQGIQDKTIWVRTNFVTNGADNGTAGGNIASTGGLGGIGSSSSNNQGGSVSSSSGGDFSTYALRQAYRDAHPGAIVDASGAYTPPGHAAGGTVEAGHIYTIGEQGPETFVSGSSGYIFPNGSPVEGALTNAAAAASDTSGAGALVAQATAALAQIAQSIPALIGRTQDLLGSLARVPAETTVSVRTDATAGQDSLNRLAASIAGLPRQTTLTVQTNAALADAAAVHLADTFHAMPRAIPVTVQLETTRANADSVDLREHLATIPRSIPVVAMLDASAALSAGAILNERLASVPRNIDATARLDTASASVASANLAGQLGAIPRSIPIAVQLDTSAATTASAALTGQLAAIPHAVPISAQLDTGSALSASQTLTAQLANIPRSVPVGVQVETAAATASASALIGQLASIPRSIPSTVQLDTGAASSASLALAAQLANMPRLVQSTVQLQTASASAASLALADQLAAIPKSVQVGVQVNTTGAVPAMQALAGQLAAMPKVVPVAVTTETKPASDAVKGFSDQLAAIPHQVAVGIHTDPIPPVVAPTYSGINIPSKSADSASVAPAIDYDKLAQAMVRAMNANGAFSVDVNNVHSALLRKAKSTGHLGLG